MSHLMGGVDAVLNTCCTQILVARDVDYRAFVKGQGGGGGGGGGGCRFSCLRGT